MKQHMLTHKTSQLKAVGYDSSKFSTDDSNSLPDRSNSVPRSVGSQQPNNPESCMDDKSMESNGSANVTDNNIGEKAGGKTGKKLTEIFRSSKLTDFFRSSKSN